MRVVPPTPAERTISPANLPKMQESDHRSLLERGTVSERPRRRGVLLTDFPAKVPYRLTLNISESHLERISTHSRESYPAEACGILIGTVTGDARTVTEVWPAKNELSSESSYEIHPETLLHAFTYADQNELEVVGFYHSHPFWSAEASSIDQARANYPHLSYLIYSIPNSEAKSFLFDGRRLIPEPVRTVSD